MPAAAKAKKVEKRITQAHVRNLERALAEERLGLTAVCMAFIKAGGDPTRMLGRVEAMVRTAVDDPKVKSRTKNALIAGQQMLERACAIEAGKPQPLFDDNGHTPQVGHVDAAQAKALADPPQEQQMGLSFAEDGSMADVRERHAEREQVAQQVRDNIVKLLRDKGALTDSEIAFHYSMERMEPHLSGSTIKDRRIELTTTRRLVDTGTRKNGKPVWDVIERAALT